MTMQRKKPNQTTAEELKQCACGEWLFPSKAKHKVRYRLRTWGYKQTGYEYVTVIACSQRCLKLLMQDFCTKNKRYKS